MEQLTQDINTIATRKADKPLDEITGKIEAYMKAVAAGGVKGTTEEEKGVAGQWVKGGCGVGVKMVDGKREWNLLLSAPPAPPVPKEQVDRESFFKE